MVSFYLELELLCNLVAQASSGQQHQLVVRQIAN